MWIKTDKTVNFRPENSRHSFCLTPEMGVKKDWPRHVCEGLIAAGAYEVPKAKPSKVKVAAEPAM